MPIKWDEYRVTGISRWILLGMLAVVIFSFAMALFTARDAAAQTRPPEMRLHSDYQRYCRPCQDTLMCQLLRPYPAGTNNLGASRLALLYTLMLSNTDESGIAEQLYVQLFDILNVSVEEPNIYDLMLVTFQRVRNSGLRNASQPCRTFHAPTEALAPVWWALSEYTMNATQSRRAREAAWMIVEALAENDMMN